MFLNLAILNCFIKAIFAVDKKSVTEGECKWLIPAHKKNITYRPVADMDFTSSKKRRKIFHKLASATDMSRPLLLPSHVADPVSSNTTGISTKPSSTEIMSFYASLNSCGHRPALLSLIEPYSDNFLNRVDNCIKPLSDLFSMDNESLTLPELQTLSEGWNDTLSSNYIENVELNTRGQSKNSSWFNYRAGRITASKFKDVCRTSTDKPSLSLMKSICYPQACKFKNVATDWGLSNESIALSMYKNHVAGHDEVSVVSCGLIIHQDYSYIGASPDSLVSCKCCGKGVVEVKCPYKHRALNICDYVSTKDCCLASDLTLNVNHKYYYQVQAQMNICDSEYCDFVICTFPDSVPSIFVQRIYKDISFFTNCLSSCKNFLKLVFFLNY